MYKHTLVQIEINHDGVTRRHDVALVQANYEDVAKMIFKSTRHAEVRSKKSFSQFAASASGLLENITDRFPNMDRNAAVRQSSPRLLVKILRVPQSKLNPALGFDAKYSVQCDIP